MPNMSYCRFRNTLNDLRDCIDHIEDELEGEENYARSALISVCKRIVANLPEEEEEDISNGDNSLDCLDI